MSEGTWIENYNKENSMQEDYTISLRVPVALMLEPNTSISLLFNINELSKKNHVKDRKGTLFGSTILNSWMKRESKLSLFIVRLLRGNLFDQNQYEARGHLLQHHNHLNSLFRRERDDFSTNHCVS